jgi:hypothetical protein
LDVPVPPTAEVSFHPRPCDFKNIDSEKSIKPPSVRLSSLFSQRYFEICFQKSLTDSGLVSFEDIGSGKSVSVLVPDKLFEMFLGGLDSSIRFGGLSASRGVGGEGSILASSRCGAIGISKTSDVLVGAERWDKMWSVYVLAYQTTNLSISNAYLGLFWIQGIKLTCSEGSPPLFILLSSSASWKTSLWS